MVDFDGNLIGNDSPSSALSQPTPSSNLEPLVASSYDGHEGTGTIDHDTLSTTESVPSNSSNGLLANKSLNGFFDVLVNGTKMSMDNVLATKDWMRKIAISSTMALSASDGAISNRQDNATLAANITCSDSDSDHHRPSEHRTLEQEDEGNLPVREYEVVPPALTRDNTNSGQDQPTSNDTGAIGWFQPVESETLLHPVATNTVCSLPLRERNATETLWIKSLAELRSATQTIAALTATSNSLYRKHELVCEENVLLRAEVDYLQEMALRFEKASKSYQHRLLQAERVAMLAEDQTAFLLRHCDHLLQEQSLFEQSHAILLRQIDAKQMMVEDATSRVHEQRLQHNITYEQLATTRRELAAAKACDPIKLKQVKFDLYRVTAEKNALEKKARSLSIDLRKHLAMATPVLHKAWKLKARLEEVEHERDAFKEAMILACNVNIVREGIGGDDSYSHQQSLAVNNSSHRELSVVHVTGAHKSTGGGSYSSASSSSSSCLAPAINSWR